VCVGVCVGVCVRERVGGGWLTEKSYRRGAREYIIRKVSRIYIGYIIIYTRTISIYNTYVGNEIIDLAGTFMP